MTSRPLSVLAAALAVAALAAGPSQAASAAEARRLLEDAHSGTVLVVAHRACWRTAPENSLRAIRDCVKLGVHMVELDVRRTRDGALVLMHDETVDRTTNGTGRVEDLTLAQIRALRLREGAGGPQARLTRQRPPTFEAAVRAARGRVLINLDAKADVYDDAFAVLAKLRAVDQVLMKKRVVVGEPALARQAPFDRVLAMPILDETAGTALDLMRTQSNPRPSAVEIISADPIWVTDAAQAVRAAGVRAWVNTLSPTLSGGLWDGVAERDPDAAWGRLIACGVTMLQTDRPMELLAYLQSRASTEETCRE